MAAMTRYSAISIIFLLLLFFSEDFVPGLSIAAEIPVGQDSAAIRLNDNVIRLFTLLETEPDKVEELAGAILKSNPGDRAALTALAWYYLRNDRCLEAYRYFSELNRIEPDKMDHVTGMIYALSGMKNLDKVIELAPVVNSFFHKGLPGP